MQQREGEPDLPGDDGGYEPCQGIFEEELEDQAEQLAGYPAALDGLPQPDRILQGSGRIQERLSAGDRSLADNCVTD